MSKDPRRAIEAAVDQIVVPFVVHLQKCAASAATVRTHVQGLRHFVAWYEEGNGALPDMRAVTTTDVSEYRQHLRTHPTQKTGQPAKPATVECRMSALRAYYS